MAENYTEIPEFTQLVVKHKKAIIASIVQQTYIEKTNTLTKKVALGNIVPLIDKVILPYIRHHEKGYSADASKDDACVHGVTAGMLFNYFKNIFLPIPTTSAPTSTTNALETSEAAIVRKEKEDLYKLVFDQIPADDLTKLNLLSTTIQSNYLNTQENAVKSISNILSDINVAELFYYKHITNIAYGCPVAIMAADPFLGFLIADLTWTHGDLGLTLVNGMNSLIGIEGTLALDKIISLANNVSDLNKLPVLATEIIEAKIKQINKDYPADATDPNKLVYRTTYLDRFINNPTNSTIAQMVVIVEKFNKNTLSDYIFTTNENILLGNLVKKYETFSITLQG